jgi:hypothetical protein
MSESNQYFRKAEECRERAETALSQDEKASWLHLADEWQKLAEKLSSIDANGQFNNPASSG